MVQDFSWTTRSGNQGGSYSDPAWSSQMNSLNIGGRDDGSGAVRQYYWTITFNNYGKQKFNTAVDDTGEIYINGVYQFNSGGYGGWSARTTPGYFAPGNYTISMTSRNTGGGPWGLAADWTGYDPPPPPTISTFSADPNPQNSVVGGVPKYSTTFTWSSSSIGPITSAQILNNAGNITLPNATGGTYSVDNLPQSVTGSNSPAQRVYTLRLCNNGGCSESPLTVSVRNDNTPSNSWTTVFGGDGETVATGADTLIESGVSNLTKNLGTLSGIDMKIKVSSPDDNVTFATGANASFANPQYFTNNQAVWMRMNSAEFNTDVSGLPSGSELGKVNDKTVSVTVGGLSAFNVTYRTRKPVIKEIFDYGNELDKYPHDDIDLIVNDPQEFTTSNTITVDDIEIPLEIRSDNPDLQVQINNGNWVNIREI